MATKAKKKSKTSKKPVKKPLKKPAAKKAKPAKALKPKKAKDASKKPAKASPKPVKAEKVSKKPEISLANPLKTFLDFWKPKADSFVTGLQRFFTEFEIPGKPQDQRQKNELSLLEKLQTSMRKEPLPDAIEEQLAQRYDRDRIRRLSSIFSMTPPVTLRVNTLKADINGFGQSLAAKDLKLKRGRLSPWSFEVGPKINPMEHPVYERGLYEVQSEASQMATILLNARPGQRILDLCGREGDNTLAIAAMMKNKGSLFVYDADPENLKIIRRRTQNAAVENTRLISGNQISELKSLDAVLVDAPCSGIGLLGSNPDLKWRFRKEELPKLQKLQAALIREGARKLKLGGHLVYFTTTLNRAENEEQIEHFLRTSHNSYRLVSVSTYLKEFSVPYLKNFYDFAWAEQDLTNFSEFDPYFVISPDLHGTQGVFAAIIERVRISA